MPILSSNFDLFPVVLAF